MKEINNKYKVLKKQSFTKENHAIVPVRLEDRLQIMKWRNEQMYHLRQDKLLTVKDQDFYFENIVNKLFDQEKPNQILFSYLEDDICIGYGGLVHINWIDKNAEISFIMKTTLEKESFNFHWQTYLQLIEQLAFKELNFHKIFTYAFDLRPHLYKAIESSGFIKEAVLKEHCFYNNEYKDVVIHSKLNKEINIKKIDKNDALFLYQLANDKIARENSFQSKEITFEEHKKWFQKKLNDTETYYYICQLNKQKAGLIRFDIDEDDNAIIGINIDSSFRGKKVAVSYLKLACNFFLNENSNPIFAYIKKTNIASVKSFERAGFVLIKEVEMNQTSAYLYRYEPR